MSVVVAKKQTPATVPQDSQPKGGPGIHLKPKLGFHLEDDLLKAFEEWRRSVKPKPDKSESLRESLREFLEKRGFWPPKGS